ncbi:hypothetical protein QQS21_011731 [Conoideocrella luteorostrata]|uniref:Arginosuccinase n=1 Tax=Conoideocrella luteorostrata TaxID=1105319 RepID=A0AAJ0CFC1_9HYPO|nr:hypothetical protein QQS21_011731 [Conoideocrella luteorostrata]
MPAYKNTGENESENFRKGRLSKPMSKLVQTYNEQPRLDWEVANLSIVLSVDSAHAVMLHEQGYISKEQAGAILQVLGDLKDAGPDNFRVTPGYGSIVLQVEKHLIHRVGEDTAGRLPIARSRLDHCGTIRRMSDRESLLGVLKELLFLHETLIKVAVEHGDTPMISYTHLQQAQPATFGHYLLAFGDRLQDSFQQLTQAYHRINRSPLGAVGLSGTDLHISRERTASLLAFDSVLENSRLGRDQYYQIELTCCLAYVMTLLNDLATDMHIFGSVEFGVIELDDSLCSPSSIFPQKKNAYGLETIKAKAGESLGWTMAAFSMFRGEGTGDSGIRTVAVLTDACRQTMGMIRLASEAIGGLTVNKERYEELLSDSWVSTNRLGNILLTSHGLHYRVAHSLVGRLVKNCLDKHIPKTDVTVDLLHDACRQMNVEPVNMTQTELTAALDHTEYINNSASLGSVSPQQFEHLLVQSTEQQLQNSSWLDDKLRRLAAANAELEAVSRNIISGGGVTAKTKT